MSSGHPRASAETTIETLVPDFRGRMEIALDVSDQAPPDVLNHNMETVPRLYKQARPGADYAHSLEFLQQFKARHPEVPTKSGLMVGLGETDDEILEVMRDMRAHDVDMLTIGQYLAPSGHHLPVSRYVHPDIFKMGIDTRSKQMKPAPGTIGLSTFYTNDKFSEWRNQPTERKRP